MTGARAQSVICLAGLLVGAMSLTGAEAAKPASTYEAVTRVADRLVATQNLLDPGYIGTWSGETAYTGSIVAGLADAYEVTCIAGYKTAAELGGQWIVDYGPPCNYYGDEAYALMRLSQISCNPASNQWRTCLVQFYACVRNQPGGTQEYIDQYWAGAKVCTSVFYMAQHTLAAYYVDAADKNIWRLNLIKFLSRVNGYQDYPGETLSEAPVYALGAATWALSEIKKLDSTPINIDGYGDSYWGSSKVSDAPVILKSHRSSVSAPIISPGSFYCWFDHLPTGAVGYTEDNVFGMLGLAAAQKNYPSLNYEIDISIVWSRTLGAIDNNGDVWGHVVPSVYPFAPYKYYAGELLTAFNKSALDGDINLDDHVNYKDLAFFVSQWLEGNGCDCYLADLNRNKYVNFTDYAILAKGWLKFRVP